MSFSLWCDFIEKDFIENDFVSMIKSGKITGATTNPSIFKSAFEKESYKNSINSYMEKKPASKVYELLCANDVKMAAYKLLTNYANSEDGFISIEIEPTHFDDEVLSVKEGKRLFNLIKMPNVMIKIPASEQGISAMEELVKKGINVNATLVFSIDQVRACLQAFEKGLSAYKKRFANAREPECVISVFVSRFDRELDEQLKAAGLEPMKYGIYNACLAYKEVEAFGVPNVRTLFASTGVKGGNAPADYYIKELAFEHSINTAPLDALNAIEGEIKIVSPVNDELISEYFAKAKEAGINYDKVCKKLFNDGITAFKEAYASSLESLSTRVNKQNSNTQSLRDKLNQAAVPENSADNLKNSKKKSKHLKYSENPAKLAAGLESQSATKTKKS